MRLITRETLPSITPRRVHGRLARTGAWAAVAVLGAGVLGSCGEDTAGGSTSSAASPPSVAAQATIEDVSGLVSALPTQQVADPPPMRVAEGVLPPTNRWFSGLAFGEKAQPVFPMPVAYTPTAGGFAVGLPTPQTSEKAIVGPALEDVSLDVGASSFEVSAYDTASVTLTMLDASGESLGTVVLVEGSPFVTYTAAVDQDVSLLVEKDDPATVEGTDVPTVTVGDRTYALATPGTIEGSTLTLSADQSVTVVAAPEPADGEDADEALAALVELASDRVTATSVTYGVGDAATSTTIAYTTAGGGPTAFVRMPHQSEAGEPSEGADAPACGLGTYATVYGSVELCSGTELAWHSATVQPAGSLDLAAVSEENRTELAEQVRADIAAIPDAPSDTYFGGKALYRDTNLLVLAEELGLDDVAAPLREELVARITEWADPDGCVDRDARCFVYDDVMRGVVGLTPSFGSDEFNDHHFHYGYFLYAAGVLAADDPDLAEELRPVMDVLAADIAAPSESAELPALRVFDAYKGHSWASGTSPFADGNNQESSSEAATAWNGLGLWAQASGNDGLAEQATWLLSAETSSALAYWTDFSLDDPVYEGFDHTIASLNWGGKRDYATWFSAEPAAMLGILVLPMSPVSGYLASDAERIRTNLEDVVGPTGSQSYDVMFGDFLLMYAALAGPDDAATALEAARALPDERIDDGNTRSYMLASIMAQL